MAVAAGDPLADGVAEATLDGLALDGAAVSISRAGTADAVAMISSAASIAWTGRAAVGEELGAAEGVAEGAGEPEGVTEGDGDGAVLPDDDRGRHGAAALDCEVELVAMT